MESKMYKKLKESYKYEFDIESLQKELKDIIDLYYDEITAPATGNKYYSIKRTINENEFNMHMAYILNDLKLVLESKESNITKISEQEALEYVEGQIEDGYVDLGCHDEECIEVIKKALDLYKNTTQK